MNVAYNEKIILLLKEFDKIANQSTPTTFTKINTDIAKQIINHGADVLSCIGQHLRYVLIQEKPTVHFMAAWTAVVAIIASENMVANTPSPVADFEIWHAWLLEPPITTYEPENIFMQQTEENTKNNLEVGYYNHVYINDKYATAKDAEAAKDCVIVFTVRSNLGLLFYKLTYLKDEKIFYLHVHDEDLAKDGASEEMLGCALYLMGHKDALGPSPITLS